MSKFKVGDRVVPVSTNMPRWQGKHLGKVIIIKSIEYGRIHTLYHWYNEENLGFYESDLISEELFNSPLWQALN